MVKKNTTTGQELPNRCVSFSFNIFYMLVYFTSSVNLFKMLIYMLVNSFDIGQLLNFI